MNELLKPKVIHARLSEINYYMSQGYVVHDAYGQIEWVNMKSKHTAVGYKLNGWSFTKYFANAYEDRMFRLEEKAKTQQFPEFQTVHCNYEGLGGK